MPARTVTLFVHTFRVFCVNSFELAKIKSTTGELVPFSESSVHFAADVGNGTTLAPLER